MNNDDKVKEMLREEKVPQELEPENIKLMLDEKAPAKKRSRIKLAGRITAGAAACAVICGTAVHFAGESNILKKDKDVINSEYEQMTSNLQEVDVPQSGDEPVLEELKPYMSGASDYGQVYQLFNNSYKKMSENYKFSTDTYGGYGAIADEEVEYAAEDNGDDAYDMPEAEAAEPPRTGAEAAPEYMEKEEVNGIGGDDGDKEDHSDTFNQEEGVLEADIAKTDGKNIYYVYNDYNQSTPYMNTAAVEDGKFTYGEKIDLSVSSNDIFGEGYDVYDIRVQDMYVYNGSIAVIGTFYASKDIKNPTTKYKDGDYEVMMPSYIYSDKDATFVSFYTTGESPKLINTYYQEGSFSNVRISPDGFMYLLTDYSTEYFGYCEEENLASYVPACGMSEDVDFIPAKNILMPVDDIEPSSRFAYTIIGSIDMNNAGEAVPADSKALAGYTGEVYSSADNIYTAVGWDDTDITRISVSGGNITPAASGTVEGRVRDQFSMSEYNGYFRIATTKDTTREVRFNDQFEEVEYEPEDGYVYYERVKRDNRLYVLDLDMNVVGSVADFGLDEEIKSVNYNGDIAYVVTYEQTDPLFAIDLSDPAAPVILDEFKLPGYSTYMQKWEDGLLFGFGISADENGRETGIKLNMFDNSDPSELKLADAYEINRTEDMFYYSMGCYDRKALLIAPEKNLIGIPIISEKKVLIERGEGESWVSYTSYDDTTSGYWFFSFEDGKFVLKGQFDELMSENDYTGYERAIYIGGYAYLLSDNQFTALSLDGFDVTDSVSF